MGVGGDAPSASVQSIDYAMSGKKACDGHVSTTQPTNISKSTMAFLEAFTSHLDASSTGTFQE